MWMWSNRSNPHTVESEGPYKNHFGFQIVDVMIDALRGIGLRVGNVNGKEFEDQGFWYQTPLALKDGRRRGTFRIDIQFTNGKNNNIRFIFKTCLTFLPLNF